MRNAAGPPHQEVELKLAVDPASLPALRRRLAALGPGHPREVESVYFDTVDAALARHRAALRLRRIDGQWVQTLKTGESHDALSRRGELDAPAPDGRADLQRHAAHELPGWLRLLPSEALAPRFVTRFTRTTWTVQLRGVRIEVALDEGEISVGDRREPLLELELELLDRAQADPAASGADALFALALQLQGGPGTRRRALALMPLAESKAARGVRLAAGRPLQPARASAKVLGAELHRRIDCAAALRSVVRLGMTAVLANARGALSGDDPEFVHQARVALRRVRSAIRVLRGHVDFPAALLGELRWLARSLGDARDWDVLATQTLPQLLSASGVAPRSAAQLLRAAQRRRQVAREQARATLASARLAALALRALRWAASDGATATPRLEQVAGGLVSRAVRRLRKAARGFCTLSDEQRHRVRILAKRLRYTLDLLAPALPRQRLRRFGKVLAELQDELGCLNDVAVARSALAALGAPQAVRAALQAACEAQVPTHLQHAERLLRRLDELPVPG
jgi:triphosphatase